MSGVCSIFSQVLGVFSRVEFEQAVCEHQRSITLVDLAVGARWWRCCSVIWAERSRCERSAEGWRPAKASWWRHMGVDQCPKRSTLAYANEHRPWELYQTVFEQLLEKCQREVRGGKKFRFKNKLLSLDGSVIDLQRDDV